jgi:hypothetical protein
MRSQAQAGEGTIGLMFDAGIPDGLHSALVWRPSPRWKTHAGLGFNVFAPGFRAGVSVSAFPFWITPALSLEAGRYFKGNANALAQMLTGDPEYDEPYLREVGYDYVSAHVGLELGYSTMTFYVHGGLSTVKVQWRDVDAALTAFEFENRPQLEVRSDPTTLITGPSGRAGFIYYF